MEENSRIEVELRFDTFALLPVTKCSADGDASRTGLSTELALDDVDANMGRNIFLLLDITLDFFVLTLYNSKASIKVSFYVRIYST